MSPGVRSPVRIVSADGTGDVVDCSPNDLPLPSKFVFTDVVAPETAWVKDDAIDTAPSDTPTVVGNTRQALLSEAVGLEKEDPALKHDLAIYKEAVLRLNKQLEENPTLKAVANYLRVPPLAVAVAGASSFAAFCLWGFCGQFVSTLLGVMLPAFESFKSVEEFSNLADPSELYAKASSMQFWLIYWVVVAVFASCEFAFYFVLSWIPFYYPIKLAFLSWLYLPKTRGANHVYHWLVKPVLKKNRHHIDAALEQSSQHIQRSVSGAINNVAMTSFGAGVGGARHLKRAVSDVLPEFGAMALKRTLRGKSAFFVHPETSDKKE